MPLRALFAIVSLTVVASFCGELPAQLPPRDTLHADVLGARVAVLGPKVRPDEAQRVAQCAYATAERLRHDYRMIGPPLFHNFLVNVGIRKRGLCFQWAEDLLVNLDALKLATLELHWGEARAGSLREHNCVVVTARGQPFRDGILLDCWRHSGRLFWSPVATDHYPWVEDSRYAEIARSKFAAKKTSRLVEEQSRSANEKGSTITASTY